MVAPQGNHGRNVDIQVPERVAGNGTAGWGDSGGFVGACLVRGVEVAIICVIFVFVVRERFRITTTRRGLFGCQSLYGLLPLLYNLALPEPGSR